MDPDDPTLELGVRRLLDELVEHEIGYIEQLYTFGDRVRSRLEPLGYRTLSVAYLALLQSLPHGETLSFYELFPWEDRREGTTPEVKETVERLTAWATGHGEREWRCRVLFGLEGSPWNPERTRGGPGLEHRDRAVGRQPPHRRHRSHSSEGKTRLSSLSV